MLKHLAVIVLCCVGLNAASLPDAPSRLVDSSFIAAHSVYAGALAFDLTLTSRGVSHGCEEASSDLGPYPSTRRIITYGLIEFSAVTVGDLALKALGRHLELPPWFQKSTSFVGASIGTFKHVRGGRAWLQNPGCL